MNRDKFDMETVWYNKESVKYACFVVREYINCKNKHVPSAVTEEEYNHAVLILLAHSYETGDGKTKVELYSCDSDCTRCRQTFCPGEFSLGEKNTGKQYSLCKYYIEEDK